MRNPGGYAQIFNGGPVHLGRLDSRDNSPEKISEGITEFDTATCAHCNHVVHIKPGWTPKIHVCKSCYKFVCEPCTAHGCTPFEKKLEEQEARDRALRSYGV